VPKAEALSAVPGSTRIFDDGSSSSSSSLSKKKFYPLWFRGLNGPFEWTGLGLLGAVLRPQINLVRADRQNRKSEAQSQSREQGSLCTPATGPRHHRESAPRSALPRLTGSCRAGNCFQVIIDVVVP
jgi:hypothetical protein